MGKTNFYTIKPKRSQIKLNAPGTKESNNAYILIFLFEISLSIFLNDYAKAV